jgi:cytoskeletal protein RodZ
MRARIDISQVEADTKIRGKYLRALENEEWSLLPGDVYVRTFMRTYAEYLGIDPRPLVDEYDRRTQLAPERPVRRHTRGREPAPISHEHPSQRPSQRPNQRPPRVISPPLLIGIALVLIVVALWVVGNLTGSSNKAPSAQVTSTPKTITHKQKTKRTKPKATTPTGTTVANTTATLKIVPTGTIYICVESASGKPLIATEYTAGETVKPVSGTKLLVNLGNADATLTVNGKSYTPSADTYPIGLEILPTGVKTLSRGPQCVG